MRRKDREIINLEEIETILKESIICRIGFCDEEKPYVVPMNFAYLHNTIYLHSAKEGRKIDMLRKNSNVCFEASSKNELVVSEDGCNCTMKFCSVMGSGKAYFVCDLDEKRKALDLIMDKYAPKSSKAYNEAAINNTTIIVIFIDEMTGKKSGY